MQSMSDPLRLVAEKVYWINIRKEQPMIGAKVLGLTIGGTLAPCFWPKNADKYFVAWAKYPSIPDDVREILSGGQT